MCRRNFSLWIVAAAILVSEAVGVVPVFAAGYWNMPGTLPQRTGHGYSGGYHAPFILGPIRLDGWGAPNEVRLPCSPCPYCPYACDCECGQTMEAPSTIEGVVPVPQEPSAARRVVAPAVVPSEVSAPAATDVVMPTVSATQPLFDAPVQP
jgi:hypothetical protein